MKPKNFAKIFNVKMLSFKSPHLITLVLAVKRSEIIDWMINIMMTIIKGRSMVVVDVTVMFTSRTKRLLFKPGPSDFSNIYFT